MTKKTDDEIDIDAPPPPCPHPEHRLGTNGTLKKHQRVCLQCGAVIFVSRRSSDAVKFRRRSRT